MPELSDAMHSDTYDIAVTDARLPESQHPRFFAFKFSADDISVVNFENGTRVSVASHGTTL